MEQFIINGNIMELGGGKSASLVFQSPMFTNLDAIVSNRTNSVDFPLTRHNLEAIEHSQYGLTSGSFMYRRHGVIYIRDGIQVFKGLATLLSITSTAIKFSFVWGNVSVFQPIFDANLRDLQTDNDYVTWSRSVIRTDPYYFYSGLKEGDSDLVLPVIPATDIIERISEKNNIGINHRGLFDEYAIPLTTRNVDAKALEADSLRITTGAVVYGTLDTRTLCASLAPASSDRDIYHQHIADGIYDVEKASSIVVKVKAGMQIGAPKAGRTRNALVSGGLYVYATDEDGYNGKLLKRLGAFYMTSSSTRNYYTLREDIRETVDVSQYKYIRFVLVIAQQTVLANQVELLMTEMYVVNQMENLGQVAENGQFPLFSNLPDWTQGDFLKNMMKLAGVFALCKEDNVIDFVSIDDIYSNRSRALDWTPRLILSSGMPAELSPTIGDFGQKNTCTYAEDETITKSYNGALVVDNTTLEKEKELITLDFGATQDDTIPLWKTEDGELQFDDSLVPRVLRYTGATNAAGQKALSFAGLEWWNIIKAKYSRYQDIIYTPKMYKVSVRLTSVELKDLDLSVPVYAAQFGHYFAIYKLTSKDSGVCEAELIQL